MKKSCHILLFVFAASLSLIGTAQDEIVWSHSYDVSTNTILMTAQLKEHWHLYSQYNDDNSGPVPTAFSFTTSEHIQLIDSVVEPKAMVVYDENFDAELMIFENNVIFQQAVQPGSHGKIEGEILFMLCDDKGCLPPALETFTLNIELNFSHTHE
jgi:hypothetical protein